MGNRNDLNWLLWVEKVTEMNMSTIKDNKTKQFKKPVIIIFLVFIY